MEFNLAMKDCDRCIELDPSFIKGYLRKGHICIALKNYQKAGEAFEMAKELDKDNQEAIEGYRQVRMASGRGRIEFTRSFLASIWFPPLCLLGYDVDEFGSGGRAQTGDARSRGAGDHGRPRYAHDP